jgi:nucleoside 2-deoxyribosyltransferase
MKVYLASSWRNKHYERVLEGLRHAGFEVYDFKNPAPGDRGFQWTEIDPAWGLWTPNAFISALDHDLAVKGFSSNMRGLRAADVVILLMPSGRSAHLEAGWAAGAGKPLVVLLPLGEPFEPELMYKMAARVVTTVGECLGVLREIGGSQALRHSGTQGLKP